MKKVKVFLGGYINYTNAQNINCRALSTFLDKNQFEVFTLTAYFGKKRQFNIRTFNCVWPFRITQHFGFLWGILNCDVAYLPKHVDTPFWVLKLARWLKKPIFTTIEGNVTDSSKPNLIALFKEEKYMQKYFSYVDEIYGITKHLIKETKTVLDLKSCPLFLGVISKSFSTKIPEQLNSLVFVGGLTKRKRVAEFLNLAEHFPKLDFHIIGDGSERIVLQRKATDNITFHGNLNHKEMDSIFQKTDLMFLPSKSEGFPKVILEAASAGIPSIIYNTYGSSDWMEHKVNGFIVKKFSEVLELINILSEKPDLLRSVSRSSIQLAKSFDWRIVIKDWEEVILNLNNRR